MLTRLSMAWRALCGGVTVAPPVCPGCRSKDYLLVEYKTLLDSERSAREKERKAYMEVLSPGVSQRLEPRKPEPKPTTAPEPEAPVIGPDWLG